MLSTREVALARLAPAVGFCLFLAATAVTAVPASPPQNIALGARYALAPAPNYSYCTDPDDKLQLTDGQSVKGYFWTQKGTVGWSHASHAVITVDLKQVQPIAGAALTTAAGAAGVVWPRAIEMFVSDDGKTFRDQGDLVQLDVRERGPLPVKYAVRRFATMGLQTRGRYVRFVILSQGAGYLFTDEVQVFCGAEQWLAAAPQGEVINDPRQWVREKATERALRSRWQNDAVSLRAAIDQAASLDAKVLDQLRSQLDGVAAALEKAALPAAADFRAVLPIGADHARLFAVQAQLWKAQGCAPCSAWTAVTWDPLDPFAAPPRAPGAPLEVHAMRGEARAAAVNLACCRSAPARVRIRFEGLPGGAAPDYLTVHEAAWTDTSHGRPVAAALPELRVENGGWTTTVSPGLVRQIWLTFQVDKQRGHSGFSDKKVECPLLPPGDYRGAMLIEPEGGQASRIPLRYKLWPLELPREMSLLVGGWCYTNGRGARDITPENRAAFLAHLQSRLVNVPWATSGALLKFSADKSDPPAIRLDTQDFDQWRRDWPQARMYMVFAAVSDSCAGAKRGTPQFARAVGSWISAWVRHWKETGLAARRVGLLLVDEPHETAQAERIIDWARAIRAAEPEVVLWEDPTFHDPRKAPAAMYEVCDVLCPNRPMWLQAAKLFGAFFADQKRGGRTLQFYSCSGPAQLLDPYSYYRLQAWHAWQVGGTGSSFWAFSDASGPSTWNPYQALGGPYSPMFLDPQGVTPGKQMEAIRESAQDYECLVMLRRAVETARQQGRTGPVVEQAQRVLDTAVDEVLAASGVDQIDWHAPKDRTLADAARVKMLESLTALAALKQ